MGESSYENGNRRHRTQIAESGPFPDCIYDVIVSYLPIRDAIRTSLVSRTWRYRWRSVPCLAFVDPDDSIGSADWSQACQNTARLLSRVLALHEGRIKRFEVCWPVSDTTPMDVWIPALAVSGIEQFIFSTHYPSYLVPSDVFCFHGLTTLSLSSCNVLLPSKRQLKGFPNLTELVLQDIEMDCSIRSLGPFITSCPKLKRLSLGNIRAKLGRIPGFEASAPSLEWLDLEMIEYYGPVCINAPKASFTKFVTYFTYESYSPEVMHKVFNLTATLRGIRNVKKLVIDSIGAFPLDNVSNLPFELPCLTDLQVLVDFRSMDQSIAAFCLLRSAPMLRRLHVQCSREYDFAGTANSFWESHDGKGYILHYLHEGCQLKHLQRLELKGLRGFPEEMTFIKFVVQNAPFLSKIDVSTKAYIKESDIPELDIGCIEDQDVLSMVLDNPKSDVGCIEHEDLVNDLLTVIKDTFHGTIFINDSESSI